MKSILRNLIPAAAILLGGSAAVAAETEVMHFGFAPTNPAQTETSAQGSGKNNYLEALVRLSPSDSPVLSALKGSKVTGVRCYLRAEYRNPTGKKFSAISAYEGSLDATPVRKIVHFAEGWNELYFDEPFTLGDEDLYVGFQVFEVQGTPYPVVSFKPASVPDSYYINIGRQGWNTYTDKGSLLIEAIIEPESTPAPAAVAMTANHPLIVAPNAPFESGIYIRNLSAESISEATVTVTAADGTVTDKINMKFDEPIAAYDGRVMSDQSIRTSDEEGTEVPLTFTVTSINGNDTKVMHPVTETFYMTNNAFERVPVIEEFTSMACVNCPFMIYYIEEARERFDRPHIYITHHSGFVYDVFTQQVDKDMEYMFNGNKRNPAVMFDRTILTGKSELVLSATSAATSDEYLSFLELSRHTPALASVEIDVDEAAGTITVSGRVSAGDKTSDGNVYISTYLLEDGISADIFPQEGINNNMAEDAPADLRDKFRHNGIIRANLSTASMGDKLEIDADGNYSVTYQTVNPEKAWNMANCHYVTFIHRNNEANLRDNIILNAADSKPYDHSSISDVKTDKTERLRVYAGPDRRIYVVSPVSSVAIYDINGRQIDSYAPQQSGVYVVHATLPDGTEATAKIAI